MIFKLTEEQIEEIIELYGGNKQSIGIVERKLNLLGVIETEEDYFEVICSVIAQKETIKSKVDAEETIIGKLAASMNFDQIIELELNRKYNNFEDAKESTRIKMGK